MSISELAVSYRDNTLPYMTSDEIMDDLVAVESQNRHGVNQTESELIRAELKRRIQSTDLSVIETEHRAFQVEHQLVGKQLTIRVSSKYGLDVAHFTLLHTLGKTGYIGVGDDPIETDEEMEEIQYIIDTVVQYYQ